MKKLVLTSALAVLVVGAQAKDGGFSGPSSQGGFKGPDASNDNYVSVEQAKKMRDDARVRLKGRIIERLDHDNYTFQDDSGKIVVDIDNHKWDGQTVTPENIVEITGEIDKDWDSVEIDVKSVRVVQ